MRWQSRLRVMAWRLLGTALIAPTLALPAQSAVSARVSGEVYDSIAAAPLADALVRLYRPGDPSMGVSTRTDARGRFNVAALTEGVWIASFTHARLDSLRLEAPLARVEVVESGTIPLALSIPSASAVARMLCPSGGDSAVTLVGEVRSAGRRLPLADAMVSVEWPEWVFAKTSTARENMRRTARTDRDGRYVLCGAPSSTVVSAQAWQDGDSTGVIAYELPASAYAVLDWSVERGQSAAAVETDRSETTAAVRTGTATVRGTVRTSAGALSGAIVRVIGSGATVRADSTGSFTIVNAVGGTQSVEARAIGFEPERRAVQLEPDLPVELSFTLTKRNVLLDTVRVVAGQRVPNDVLSLERRWRQGQGTFIDGETVRDRTSTMVTTALVGVPGIRLAFGAGYGNTIVARNFVGGECQAILFLDGLRFATPGRHPVTLDEIVAPEDVAVLEVYARSSTIPAEYLTVDGCGAVAVWTKRGLGNIPVFDPRTRR